MFKVLIVEDDPMVSMLNKEFSERIEGVEVIAQAGSVPEAWEVMKKHVPDLILLDIYLPGQTGLEFAEALKKEGIFSSILFISAADDKNSVQDAVRYGAVDYLIKPFTFERFKNAVERIILFNRALSDQTATDQRVIDQYFNIRPASDSVRDQQVRDDHELPKGISKITTRKVVKEILKTSDWFTTENIASSIGLSRISTKKYIQFLVDAALLEEEMDYQNNGRPAAIFKVNNQQYKELKELAK